MYVDREELVLVNTIANILDHFTIGSRVSLIDGRLGLVKSISNSGANTFFTILLDGGSNIDIPIAFVDIVPSTHSFLCRMGDDDESE
jgi:hypothetical protein